MPVTPPATGPDEIDAALSYAVATGRTNTWVFGGHCHMIAPVWYQHQAYSGQYTSSYDFGPFLVHPSDPDLPYAQVYIEFNIGIYSLRFEMMAQEAAYATKYWHKTNNAPAGYYLHDSETQTLPDSDPDWSLYAAVPQTYGPGIAGQHSGFLNTPYFGQAPVASFDCLGGPLTDSCAGIKYTFRDRLSGTVISTGTVNNNASQIYSQNGASVSFTAPNGQANHSGDYLIDSTGGGEHGLNSSLTTTQYPWMAVVEVDDDWTIEIDMVEVGISRGRNVWDYEWRPTQWRVTCGSATFTFTDTSPVAMDSVCGVKLVVAQTIQNGRRPDGFPSSSGLSRFVDWGYTADWLAEVSSWSLSGTQSGNGLTSLGSTTLPIISVLDKTAFGFYTGEIDSNKIRVQVDGSTDTSISTTISGHSYTWYVANQINAIGPAALCSGATTSINLAPLCTNTLGDFDERWFDNTPFDRDPADAFAIRIAAYISSWNGGIAGTGTAFTIPGSSPSAILSSAGFSLGTSPSVSYAPLVFSPYAIAYDGTGINPAAFNWPEWFIAENSDPFDTVTALGRDIGSLTFTVTQRVLPSISLSVSSDAMGGSNTDSVTTSLGNFAANRYLKAQCSSISLATGHKATLTLRTHDNHDIVYTLDPDPGTGIAIIDLTNPDNWGLFSWGVGLGLYNPVPRMNSTAGTVTTYSRVSNDVSAPSLNARIEKVTLTVPGPSETFDITSLDFDTPHFGFDGWTDPLGDGSGWAYQQADAHFPPPNGSDSHHVYFGRMYVLVDGKPALIYPYYANWPLSSFPPGTSQTYWEVPLMVADLLNDLPILNTGLGASFTPWATPSSTAITANNCPLGLIWADDSPYGANSYIPWTAGVTTYTFRRKLTQLTIPRYCCNYTLVGSKLHGGGLEGIAYDRSTHAAYASSTMTVKHALIPGGTRDSTNYPTADETVSTDAGGFFRTIFYDKFEKPNIKKMVNPLPSYGPVRPPYIRELAYSHFAALLSLTTPGVTNLGSTDGVYHVAGPLYDVGGGPAGIQYWQSMASTPGQWTMGGGSTQIVITSDTRDGNPSLALDCRMRLLCAFDRDSVGTMICWSDDDGETWSDPIMSIAGGTNAVVRCGKDGSMFEAAYVDDGSGVGVIKGIWRPTPDGTPSSVTTFKDETGTDIPVQPGQFGLDHLAETGSRWALTVLVDTETAPSTWLSADDAGCTFLRVP